MSKIKIAGIVLLSIGLVGLIIWAAIELTSEKDTKTGVSNDKIEKAAIASGLPKPLASIIASSPDSASTARKIGISPVASVAISNGVSIDSPIPINVTLGNHCDCRSNKVYVITKSDGSGYWTNKSCVCNSSLA